jgi:hypothetical protein
MSSGAPSWEGQFVELGEGCPIVFLALGRQRG